VIKLVLPAPLAQLLANGPAGVGTRRRAVSCDAASWQELVAEIRTRHPLLAERMFDGSGRLAPGLVAVVNSEIVPLGTPIQIADGDDVSLIPQIAGG
jgi:molybdopterin converting factor small subunit